MRSRYPMVRWALLWSLVLLVLVALGGAASRAAQGDLPVGEAMTAPQSDSDPQGLPPGDATRFRGYVLMGYPDAPGKGLPGVVLKLYGRHTGQPRPGQLLQQRVTDGSGFFNFYLLPISKNQFDYYLLEVVAPAGYVPTGVWSENGTIIDNTHVEWLNPGGPANFIHMNRFYLVRGYELTILHTNDFHARVEEYQASGATCTAGAVCLGGSARIKTVADEIRRTRPHVLLVDAGDQFQGTLYYGLFRSAVIAQMMNALGYDAMTVGNHEFDHGPAELGSLAEGVNFPIVSSNLDVSAEPSLAGKLVPTAILTRGGERIGIIGLTTPDTPIISSPGPNVVVRDVVSSAQTAVNELTAQGVNKIVALTHLGYQEDLALARTVTGIDVIVGGHSHTFTYTPVAPQRFGPPTFPAFSPITPEGPYPTVVTAPDGNPVLVVTAYQWGTFLGRLEVLFDPQGVVAQYDGNPIFLGNAIAKDPTVEHLLRPFRGPVNALRNQVVAESKVDLPITEGGQLICRLGECLLGSLVADAMLWKTNAIIANPAERYQIAIQNGGGLRAPIMAGKVSRGQILETLPFGNTIATMQLRGSDLLAALENGFSAYGGTAGTGRFPQVAGLRVIWNPAAPPGSRVMQVEVRQADGSYSPLDPNAVYRVVTNDFMRRGGDGYTVFRDRAINPYDFGPALDEALADYMAMLSPVEAEDIPGDRIIRVDKIITILHTNDTHGYWEATTYRGVPQGFEYLATLIARERADNPNVILLDAGDTFQGNAFAQYFRNATPNPIAGGLNMLRYDAFVLGNHEFNFGPQTFATMLGQLQVPILGKANLIDDGSYGFINDRVQEYINLNVDGVKVTIWGTTNPRVYRYELPTNIPGLTFLSALDVARTRVPEIRALENPDLFIALNHIGYAPYGDEIDSDRLMAEQVAGIDVIIGGHSHTKLDPAVLVTSPINPKGTLIAQAERYAMWLGKVTVGLRGKPGGGYEVVYRAGRLLPAGSATPDPAMRAYLQPFLDELNAYISQPIGQTTTPIDALRAYTEETNGANLQADASVYVLEKHNIPVDFHLSGAMSNRRVADGATPDNPVTLTVNDMYTLMPYENSLVVISMNGPQIKRVLERAYRNYWYYKYVPDRGGYSYYTTCMLDINAGGVITYRDAYPEPPDGNNVVSVVFDGTTVDLQDPNTYYRVSTVNYLAAGSCNFNDAGETIWPLDQIVADTQYYVRDAVIEYIQDHGTIAPAVEGRLVFLRP